jgi:hypothetical protein
LVARSEESHPIVSDLSPRQNQAMKVESVTEREFEYRPSRPQALLLFVMVCLGQALLVWFAIEEPKDPAQNLDREGFRRLMTGMACIAPLSVVGFAVVVWSSFFQKRRIALTADSIIVPKPRWHGMSNAEVEIPFGAITHFQIRRGPYRQDGIHLRYAGGKVAVLSIMIPTRREFEDLVATLSSRFVRSNRQ